MSGAFVRLDTLVATPGGALSDEDRPNPTPGCRIGVDNSLTVVRR